MVRSRRSVLGTISLTVLAAGCLGDDGRSGNGSSSTQSPSSTRRSRSPTTPTTNEDTTLRVNATVNESEYQYVESENAVRYVAGDEYTNPTAIANGSPPTREPTYRTIPFDRWARIECASAGADELREHLREHIDGGMRGIEVGVTTRGATKTIVVTRSTTRNRAGEVTATPGASDDQLKRLAPSTVVATITLADRRHTCTVPVTTRNVTEQLE